MLWDAYFDRHDAFPSAARCCCAKACACALLGMLVHEDAANIVKIKDGDLRKVCADYLSASTASIATLCY